jgi:hypothetical protein
LLPGAHDRRAGRQEFLNALLQLISRLAGKRQKGRSGKAQFTTILETGGGLAKTKEQAHAQITHVPQSEMRSPLAEDGETVLLTSDEER